MKNKYIIISLILVFILASCSNNGSSKTDETENQIRKNQVKEAKANIIGNNSKILEPILLNISINDFKQELLKNDATIIDLRTTAELEETGIIKGSKQMNFYDTDFKNKLNNLEKNKKYLIYCRSGGRSSQALKSMKQLGFTNVYELTGGMNGWLSSGEKTVNISELNNEEFSIENSMMMNMSNIMTKTVILNAINWEFDQKIIKVKKGQELIIKVNNTDGLHGIAIPDMKIMDDNEIKVDTSKAGEYEFRCLNYCGAGHQDMTGKIIIE